MIIYDPSCPTIYIALFIQSFTAQEWTNLLDAALVILGLVDFYFSLQAGVKSTRSAKKLKDLGVLFFISTPWFLRGRRSSCPTKTSFLLQPLDTAKIGQLRRCRPQRHRPLATRPQCAWADVLVPRRLMRALKSLRAFRMMRSFRLFRGTRSHSCGLELVLIGLLDRFWAFAGAPWSGLRLLAPLPHHFLA